MRSRWLKGLVLLLVMGGVLPPLALFLCALREPLPTALRQSASAASVEVYDRNGRLLRVVRTSDGQLSTPAELAELSPYVVPALLAAEDARFFRHFGVDPLAIVRAGAQAVAAGRLVSGASTLTQQLARNLVPRPRTLAGKWHEMVVSVRIELELDKRRILQEYLNRIEFGPKLSGIEAASRYYFDKPARELSLAEAATLVAIPRGPTLYDPRRNASKLLRRRDRVLERLRAQGSLDEASIARALGTALTLALRPTVGGAEHLTLSLLRGRLAPELEPERGLQRIDTTIDAELEREVLALSRQAARDIERFEGSALAVLVLDNPSGEVLAYVGSPDFSSAGALGQNDGTQALRQPGSTLKPFVYAAALQELGMTAATLLPDIELFLPAAEGDVYAPKNYDRKSHGPVRLREALGSSLNVPAVWTAEKVGVERVLQQLRRFGLRSLGGDAVHYGPAIALGDGEVRLSELCAAYATLARGGTYRPVRYVRGAVRADGARVTIEPSAEERVLDARLASLLTDILSDREARAGSFGLDGVLSLPFPVAVKTGTSKGLRDNWAIGYTREVTVAVWAGNFDGSPLVRSSGVTGAAPLFREVMLAAMRKRSPAALDDHAGLVQAEICALSGALATRDCPHHLREWFVPGREPHAACEMHERVRIDRQTELRAGASCRDAEERVFERYEAPYESWAARAERPLAPRAYAPRCPGPPSAEVFSAELVFPTPGAHFVLDPLGPARQEIMLQARASSGREGLSFLVDGHVVGRSEAPFQVPWPLAPGLHTAVVARGAEQSSPVTFVVRDGR